MPRGFSKSEAATIRQRLLHGGRALAATVGFRRMTIGKLTRAAGISTGAFYLFYPSKEALLAELLGEVEGEVRHQLEGAAKSGSLLEVLTTMFEAIPANPLLRPLGDPDELAWLTRVLGTKHMDDAQASDDAFFLRIGRQLRRRGELAPDVDPAALGALARVALGVAQQRSSLGPKQFAATVKLLVEGMTLRLARKAASR